MPERINTSLVRLQRTWNCISEAFESHQDFVLILALFLSLRLSLLVISQPQGYLLNFSDYDYYLDLGRLSDRGLYPMLQYWTEYPPVFPWIAVAAYRATEVIPSFHGSPIFWFRLALGGIMLLFDAGNLVLIYRLGRRLYDPTRALRLAWSYALLFAPLHVWLAWFDTVPLFFLLLSVTLAVEGKRSGAALVAGAGFMVKVMPILALPLLLKMERRFLYRLSLAAEAALAALLLAAPFLVEAPQYLLASFQSMLARSPWETPWAILEGYFGYGEVAPLPNRVDPASATFASYPSHLPWPAITAVFAALYLLLWTRRFDATRGRNAVAFAGLTVNLFLLYSKGYSPQFLAYVVPFVLLTLPPLRGVAYLALLATLNLLEYPVYGVLIPDAHWLLHDLVTLRTLILLLLCWEYLAALELIPSLDSVRRAAAGAALLAFVLWGAFALPKAGDAWLRTSLEQSSNGPLVDYLLANAGPQAVVVFSDQGLYRELYPYLYRHTNLSLVEAFPGQRVASRSGAARPAPQRTPDPSAQLAQLSSRYHEIFDVVELGDLGGRRLEQLLGAGNRLESSGLVKGFSVSRWSRRP